MFNSPLTTLLWIEKLIAVAIVLQTLELLQIRETISEGGVWRWSTLKKEFEVFPLPAQKVLALLLNHPNFLVVLLARLVCAVLIFFFPHPALIFVLLLSSILICLRWRGTFNGGSDYMTLVILSAAFIAAAFQNHPPVVVGALWYISIQVCLSYFVAGLVKLKRSNWRTGAALSGFLNSASYLVPPTIQTLIKKPWVSLLASWSIIIFECAFPIALFSPQVCAAMIALAFLFHLGNVYVFGLNRFLFAWCAAYPALYYCSGF